MEFDRGIGLQTNAEGWARAAVLDKAYTRVLPPSSSLLLKYKLSSPRRSSTGLH